MDRLLAFLRRIFGKKDDEAGNHSQNKHDEKKEPNEVQKVEEKQHPYENVTLNKENVDIASSNEIQEKMLTEENEYYLRIILLLCGGCLYVTKRFLEQELKNRDEKLDNLLKRKERKLRHELHKKQVERLFPNDGFDKTDIDTWDIQMILCVLVHVLDEPDSKEKKLIRELKKYRNDIIAHRATTTLNKKDFDTFQSDIQDTMKHLASKCSSSVQKDCEMYISSSLTGPLDISKAEKYLQELAESEEKVQEIIDKFKSLKKRIRRSDETTWNELNEIHCDLKELKSYFKTASKELENQIGVSNEGLNQLEDSLASKFRAHNQKEDPGVRKSVVPRELAKTGQSTSIPQTTQPVKRFVTVDGKEMDAIEVMSATISFFQKKVLEVIRSFIWVNDFMKFQQQIRWVLTVPAIWTDSAKQFMRKAAIRAGLQTDKLRIALEPEVAGIYCITEGLYGTQSILATFGHKYIVVDMGGGTVDITPLAFEHHDGFKVLHKPSGCACGSTKVDIAFFKLIEDLLGRDFFLKYSTENREDHIDFQRNFEWKKLAISNKTTDDIMLRIPMLHQYQNEMGDVNEAIKKSAYREAISYSRLKLRISSDTLKSFFKPCSDEIIQHIDDVLRTVSDEGIKAIILTGGFSESSLMQNSIATAFPNLKVLVPENPIKAVLRGAVLYGLTPDIIISREIKYTYGIEISPLFDATKHDESRRVVICGKERCKNVFRKFVGIGEKVSNDTTVCQEHSTIVPYQEEVFFKIFCSETSHPMYTDETGVSFLGTLQVSIPKRETSDFNVKFGFGGTEISVTTVDLKTKQENSCKVDFLG